MNNVRIILSCAILLLSGCILVTEAPLDGSDSSVVGADAAVVPNAAFGTCQAACTCLPNEARVACRAFCEDDVGVRSCAAAAVGCDAANRCLGVTSTVEEDTGTGTVFLDGGTSRWTDCAGYCSTCSANDPQQVIQCRQQCLQATSEVTSCIFRAVDCSSASRCGQAQTQRWTTCRAFCADCYSAFPSDGNRLLACGQRCDTASQTSRACVFAALDCSTGLMCLE